ncbi:3-phosphoshikimate 1-carboxyvinyltransferase [Verrucomicrobia bacterium]|nr:3-phosphoshikimate 1-carboxyvinyltransferase [Verrucomicrobiota bacterium]
MSLPEVIEMTPLPGLVQAEVTVPGSKSITNRALILSCLGEGETTLEGALWSEDTQVMVECLQELGFMINVTPDPEEPCNRTITVYGKSGHVPPGGSEEHPLELFVGNAGTAARFLAALLCLGRGVYRVQGVPRMHERPQAALFRALRELGYRIESPNDRLPALVYGEGPRAGRCRVSIEDSSQFASALMLVARAGGWQVEVTGQNTEESGYVGMTAKLIEALPKSGGVFAVEPDASSGTYFLAASETVSVKHWPRSGWQVDANFSKYSALLLNRPPSTLEAKSESEPLCLSRRTDLGDSIMMAIVLAPLTAQTWQFTDLGRLRLQESERVAALREELSRCGAKVVESRDTLEIFPSRLHGADIQTYQDHRMAMCFAILGLKVPGIKIKNPDCVKKTFPNFFQKLAASPPRGLGAVIHEVPSGRSLSGDDLFAQ